MVTFKSSVITMAGNMHNASTPKTSTRFACWNIHTLSKLTKLKKRLRELLRTLEGRKAKLVAPSEVWLNGHVEATLHDCTILYSHQPKQDHLTKGVAV